MYPSIPRVPFEKKKKKKKKRCLCDVFVLFFLLLVFFIKAYVVCTHLNCIHKLMQFK